MRTFSIILLSLSIVLTGCGPSNEEIQSIATTSCNTMGPNLIMELNSARKEIGEEPFSGTYNEILYARQWGICEELVLNDPSYEQLASELMDIENHFRPVIRNITSLLYAEVARGEREGSNYQFRDLVRYKSEQERITALYETEIDRIVSQL